MNKEIKAEIISRLETILQVDPGSLCHSMKMDDHPGWDSVVHLEVMLLLEQCLSIEINELNIHQYSLMSNILKLIEDEKN